MENWLNNVVAKSTAIVDWRLIGSIGQWREINSRDFNFQLSSLEGKHETINMIIHSGGGSIYEGLQLFNRANKSKATINVDIEGLAASMASALAMAGKHRRIAKNGRMMLHQGKGEAKGSGNKMIEKGEELNRLNGDLAEIYAEAIKWKHPDRDAKWVAENWLAEGKDKWFTAEEAKEAGLVHEVYDSGLKGTPPTGDFDAFIAFYDNSLATSTNSPSPDDHSKNSNTNSMKKEQIILMLAKHGITFDDQVTADADDNAFINAVSGKIKELKTQAAESTKLQARLEELEGNAFQDELQAAQADGRITTKQVPHYEKIADKFGNDEAIAALKEIDAPSAEITLKKRKPKSPDQELDKEREKWNYQAWEENDPDGLIALADDDPDKYEALVADYDPDQKSNATK